MFSRCVFCNSTLPKNELLEQFPLGRRIAFDPARGRLWAVCGKCQRWNLAPIDERWEVLDQLEKLVRDDGRHVASTEHIALVHVKQLDVVRVGRAQLAEEAWWRYGSELRKRNRRYRGLVAAEWGIAIGLFPIIGIGLIGGGSDLNRLTRWGKFGSIAWRGDRVCRRCGTALNALSFKQVERLTLKPSAGTLCLELHCTRCGMQDDAGFVFEGTEAERLLRRSLAYHNYAGANEVGVKAAVRTIEQAGSTAALIDALGRQRFQVADRAKRSDLALALEVAVNDDAERELLELQLAELEARWREEEELAAIIDGELTDLPLLEKLRLRMVR